MKKSTNWINFLGGSNLLYTLIVLILLAILILLMIQLDFLFTPIAILISNILMPLIVALLLYYLFDPLISFAEKHGLNRTWGIIILYLIIILGFVGALLLLVPLLENQFNSLIRNFPQVANTVFQRAQALMADLPADDITQRLLAEAQNIWHNISGTILAYVQQGFTGVSSFVSGMTSIVFTLATAPIILFFLLKSGRQFFEGFLKIIPPNMRPGVTYMASEINGQVSSYIKGQLVIAVLNGIMMFIGFTVIGMDYSGVLGVMGGVFSLIPYLGPILTFIPAILIAFFDSFTQVLLLLVVWLIIQFIEGNLVEPNVMGKQLEIHPLTIIITLVVMGDLLGLFGLIFGIPIYAIIKVIVRYIFNNFKIRYNTYFAGEHGQYDVRTYDSPAFDDDHLSEAIDEFEQEITENND